MPLHFVFMVNFEKGITKPTAARSLTFISTVILQISAPLVDQSIRRESTHLLKNLTLRLLTTPGSYLFKHLLHL